MTEKFTPGEWDWFVSDSGDGYPIIYSGDIEIAEVYLPNGNGEQMLYNAFLLQAAPKMYSLLKLARHEFEAVAEWCDEHDLPDDAKGYRNLANGILDVLMEIRGKGGEG